MKSKNNFLVGIIAIAILAAITACNPHDNEVNPTFTKTFYSQGSYDGIAINSTPVTVSDYYAGSQGKEITIGWNASGHSMRGYLSFNIAEILPKSDEKLVVDKAVLSVYEANTNLLPFTGGGLERVVECYIVDYGTLDASDYNEASLTKCGVIATTGYNVLKEYPLDITKNMNFCIEAYGVKEKLQFRLQFSSNSNVNSTSPLAQAMWNIFSGDEVTGSKKDYIPKVVITYHYEKK